MSRTVRFGLIIVLAVAMPAAAFGQSIHGPTLSGAQIAGVVAVLGACAVHSRLIRDELIRKANARIRDASRRSRLKRPVGVSDSVTIATVRAS